VTRDEWIGAQRAHHGEVGCDREAVVYCTAIADAMPECVDFSFMADDNVWPWENTEHLIGLTDEEIVAAARERVARWRDGYMGRLLVAAASGASRAPGAPGEAR